MAIWAIGDLHLALGVPKKRMDTFGGPWINYTQKIEENWRKVVQEDDLVLIPGDISWAMTIEDVIPDLEWIHNLPGTKVVLRGNHDYWWTSLNKVEKILPPSIHLIQNNSFFWNDVAIGGARLWDTPEYAFGPYINYTENPLAKNLTVPEDPRETEKLFLRELGRLELSLQSMNPAAKKRIAMTHYPPIGVDLGESRTAAILEKYKIDICVFGHLHNIKPGIYLFGNRNDIKYVLASADYIDFKPVRLVA